MRLGGRGGGPRAPADSALPASAFAPTRASPPRPPAAGAGGRGGEARVGAKAEAGSALSAGARGPPPRPPSRMFRAAVQAAVLASVFTFGILVQRFVLHPPAKP